MADGPAAGLGSPRGQALATVIVISLLCAPVSWIDDGITPSWVVYPVVLLIALWRVSRGSGALFVGIAALVFFVVHVPWTIAALTGGESPVESVSPSPVQWLVTLFAVPLATCAVGFRIWFHERSQRLVAV
jgi:hypothetical protein